MSELSAGVCRPRTPRADARSPLGWRGRLAASSVQIPRCPVHLQAAGHTTDQLPDRPEEPAETRDAPHSPAHAPCIHSGAMGVTKNPAMRYPREVEMVLAIGPMSLLRGRWEYPGRGEHTP